MVMIEDEKGGGEKSEVSEVSPCTTTQEWKPRWGYKRAGDPKQEWVVELPADAGEYYNYNQSGTVGLSM